MFLWNQRKKMEEAPILQTIYWKESSLFIQWVFCKKELQIKISLVWILRNANIYLNTNTYFYFAYFKKGLKIYFLKNDFIKILKNDKNRGYADQEDSESDLKSDSRLPKKMCFIFFDGNSSKMMTNAFYFILKVIFVFKIFKVLSWLFDRVEKAGWLER